MKLRTRLRSRFMRIVSSERYQEFARRRARFRRRLTSEPATVHYFHEVADPYSHLVVQRLDALRDKYALGFRVHLTTPASDAYRGDASRYWAWARTDAASIARGFGVSFPEAAVAPAQAAEHAAIAALARAVDSPEFAPMAIEIGHALWSGHPDSAGAPKPSCEAANQLRARLGHYAGGMLYFEGEWYWGLDRLELLERRLIEEGFGDGEPVVTTPEFTAPACPTLKLEVFPSLRSPYTAISFDRTLALAERTGVQLVVRPVMPMMMRGVPAPGKKGAYIIMDAGREARRYGVPFGRIVDPFGEPVKLAYSLYPLAAEAGLERAFISRYLRAAWAEGVDISGAAGLKQIIEDIGLRWQDAGPLLGGNQAEAMLDENVSDMLQAGLWGVPSFRVSGGDAPPFSCWGQDRLWRVEEELIRRTEA